MRVVTGLSQICWDVSPQGQAAYGYGVWGKEGRESKGGYTYMQMVTQLLSLICLHTCGLHDRAHAVLHARTKGADRQKKKKAGKMIQHHEQR